jgi:two-component system nitrate/nitrite response regulator NarL
MMDPLATREYQVVMLVSRGLSNKEIARQLGISDGTVKLHVHKILHSSRGRVAGWWKRRSKQVAV